ncbi:uncharacterized protein FSUBG_11445 [Fusarium subglutinans]|uniref:Uncharacterized protein n=1 Tax=Gibberella subglutinans TaxID=42677 RepID=A0A8H5LCL6_GIBSU|nr:uncharacterized protein FSUBG_11445 [Fusarium subglutinans]KAF5588588.1 hypothetical protein FSUBG_11445 [Fusarium subglutinans]
MTRKHRCQRPVPSISTGYWMQLRTPHWLLRPWPTSVVIIDNTKCGVVSYFLNVGLGDGIIVLMFTVSTVQRMKKVERAVLMHGGPDPSKNGHGDGRGEPHHNIPLVATMSSVNIDRAIRDIERDFECQGDPDRIEDRKRLVFDGFVETHWDKDLARGVMWYPLQYMMGNRDFSILSRARYDKDDELETYFYAPT